MLDDDPALPPAAPSPTAQAKLAQRLVELICMPASRISPQERHIAGDLLIEMLREADIELRARCAERLARLSEAPSAVVRQLARDDLRVARHVLEESAAMSEGDLAATARTAGAEHREVIASRRHVPELIAEAVAARGEPSAIERLLGNPGAQVSRDALERIVAESRTHRSYIPLLVERAELRPSLALVLFWWADAESRRAILRRFAVERRVLQESASDVFALAAAEGWSDPLTRKILQFIERRQRSRDALRQSPYASLESAIEAVVRDGIGDGALDEISYLSGVKPVIGKQIMADAGGEPVAVMCKAVGLKRPFLRALWSALGRPIGAQETPHPDFQRVVETFDMLAVDKAQTVLRYWNWSLTSTPAPGLENDEPVDADLSAPEYAVRMVFGS